ncbi:MAG: L-threonylcarbamoyladenylate synthase [Gemmataceae bacterium]
MPATRRLLPADLATAAALLRAGRLVAFPTETVYGLGADALDEAAVRRIFEAKGRPSHNPLIVHVAGPDQAAQVAHWSDAAALLARRFWPGPLTLVLPRRGPVPDAVTGGGPTVAVRQPDHPLALALLAAAGVPLAAPSANRSGRLSPTTADHVLADLDGRIDAVLDGGPTSAGIESTVLDLSGPTPRLLRPGPILPAALEALVGPVGRGVPPAVGALPSPGMLERHYAPRTPLTLAADDGAALLGEGGGLLTHLGTAPPGVTVERLPADAAGYAAGLYAALHRLDRLGLTRIVVAAPPDGEAWLAVRDRLRRAAF